jgi:hypothetical protein
MTKESIKWSGIIVHDIKKAIIKDTARCPFIMP